MRLKNRSPDLQAAAVSGVLSEVCRIGCRITYAYLAEHVGMHPHSASLWEALSASVSRDLRGGLPVSACAVSGADGGVPPHLLRILAEAGVEDPSAEFVERQLRLLHPSSAWSVVLRPVYL